MPITMSTGGNNYGNTGLGAAGKESPYRTGNPAGAAVSYTGTNIAPPPPVGGTPLPTYGIPTMAGPAGISGAGGGPAGGGGAPTGVPSIDNFTSPWGKTYSTNDQTALLNNPQALLQEMLAAQGINNPTNVARYGQSPQAIAALLPFLNGGSMDPNGVDSLGLISGLLGNQSTPGAGGIDLAAVLQQILSSGGQDPNSLMGAIGNDQGATDSAIQAVMAMMNPIMAPYLNLMFGNAQDNYDQASLDANGGQNMGPYSQWLGQQLGMGG